ncbi:MAG: diacylglycerol kinase family protein [Phycisphaerales bacterium]|nr:diacylglycerol kinase family protein [Phycisphaerales bacterium]
MRITLILNPKSGRGKSIASAQKLEPALIQRGHQVEICEMTESSETLESAMIDSDRAIVVGGDGTVHHLLTLLSKTQTPFYHFGTGTANLISHEFGMSKNPERVVQDLESICNPIQIDLPRCNGHPFLIMLSIGLDASVIHRFEESRSLSGGYRAYIKPVIRELFNPRPARYLFEQVSNDTLSPKPKKGTLVLSNLKSYGGHFNPSPEALPTDGKLNAVSLPGSTTVQQLINFGLLRCRLNPFEKQRQCESNFRITATDLPVFVQVDGEKASMIKGLEDGKLMPKNSMTISVENEHVQVLSRTPL